MATIWALCRALMLVWLATCVGRQFDVVLDLQGLFRTRRDFPGCQAARNVSDPIWRREFARSFLHDGSVPAEGSSGSTSMDYYMKLIEAMGGGGSLRWSSSYPRNPKRLKPSAELLDTLRAQYHVTLRSVRRP